MHEYFNKRNAPATPKLSKYNSNSKDSFWCVQLVRPHLNIYEIPNVWFKSNKKTRGKICFPFFLSGHSITMNCDANILINGFLSLEFRWFVLLFAVAAAVDSLRLCLFLSQSHHLLSLIFFFLSLSFTVSTPPHPPHSYLFALFISF